MKTRQFTMLFLIVTLLVSCAPKSDFDIRGEWEYTMTDTNGNTYDAGAMSFSGEPAKGTYLEINIYEVEYEGEFTVNGSIVKLTGYETWEGSFIDTNTLTGTWMHEDGFSGTFAATRK